MWVKRVADTTIIVRVDQRARRVRTYDVKQLAHAITRKRCVERGEAELT